MTREDIEEAADKYLDALIETPMTIRELTLNFAIAQVNAALEEAANMGSPSMYVDHSARIRALKIK